MKRFKRAGVWFVKITIAILFISILFFLYLELFNPLRLDKVKDLSRIVVAEDRAWLFATLNKEQKWRFKVESQKLDPLYLKMLLNFEDKRFYHHIGVDPLALMRASWQLLISRHITSGGSTITMQLARLLEPKKRTIASKIFEIFRALELELHFSKKEILEAYLTLTPYGGNIEGIVAASMHYFGKVPSALTAAQAAMLVSLPQSPEHNRPDRHPRWAKIARNKVLLRSLQAQLISQQLYLDAQKSPIERKSFHFPRFAPHLSLKLLQKYKKNTVETTLHLPLQSALEKWAVVAAKPLPKDATLAIVVVRNNDAAVVSYIGSYNLLNRQNAGFVDMLTAVRSPGSLLKPLIYGMALEEHILDTNTIIEDKQIQIGNYRPHNYTKEFHGDVTVAKALQNSLNIPAVKVLQKVGASKFIKRVQRVAGKIIIPQKRATLPVALGGIGITPLQVAQIYTLLANGGSGYKLHFLQTVQQQKREILNPKAAIKITNILREMHPPDGYRNSFFTIAYKTGTSYGYRDFWSAAYTKEYTVVVWVGKANNAPLFKASAREVAAPFAFEVMQSLQSILPHESWSFAPNTTTALAPPPLLQYFEKRADRSNSKFDFLYPKEGTRYQSASCQDVNIQIALKGGKAPYSWYIDDKPNKIEGTKATLRLNIGAHTLTVIDKKGTQITRSIWINASECQK